MKPSSPRTHARAAAWRAATITFSFSTALTLLACRALWTSHMDEADRQLKAAAPAFAGSMGSPRPAAGFLSGGRAPLHLIFLSDPSGKILTDDPAWPAGDRAALEIGGRFITRIHQSTAWRVMGFRQDGWSLRLAMDASAVLSEVLTFLTKALLLSTAATLAAAFAAGRHAANWSARLSHLATCLPLADTGHKEILTDSSDPPEIALLKSALQAKLDAARLTLDSARRFGADAGHELRTPLAVIQGSVDAALQRPARPDQWPAFLESVLVQCRKLRVTLDSLQLLARADAGTVTLHCAEFQLDLLIRSLLEDLSAETDSMDLTLTTDLTPIRLSADPGLIRLALWNLLINAARHNLDHGGTITLSLLRAESPPTAILTLSNSGPPLAPDEHPHIFQRFHRGRTARQAGVAGQGLGLSLALACATSHGGSLTLLRSDSSSTVFELRLPAL